MRRVKRVIAGAFAVVLIAVAVIVFAGGEDYRIDLQLANAAGLREGSDVVMGGIRVGTVDTLRVDDGDQVVAELSIDPDEAPVGTDVSAYIASVNLLGQKRVELVRGDTSDPAPSGFTVAESRVETSVDIDQIIGVLDGETRSRLVVLINEAGAALGGRAGDLAALLEELPASAADGAELLSRLVSDNETLARLVEESDRLVARVAGERRQLTRLIDEAGRAAGAMASRRERLRETLAEAPGALTSLRRFMGELRTTTVPLAPAARAITQSAPPLAETLAEVEPFREAADPTLQRAREVAPALTRLARGATPVLRRTVPVAGSLDGVSESLVPITEALDQSFGNILAVVDNWSRAVALRDGASHLFRGGASITPETLVSAVQRLIRLDLLPERAVERAEAARSSDRGGAHDAGRAHGAAASESGVDARRRRDVRTPRDAAGSHDGANEQTPAAPPRRNGPLTDLLDLLFKP